jgi:hypothetical protein
MKPKEDPADKAARVRERRLSDLELSKSAQENARGLSTDLFSVYGMTRGGRGTATGARVGSGSTIPLINTLFRPTVATPVQPTTQQPRSVLNPGRT